MLYISTDYVFNGQKEAPYVEEDDPAPINIYGMSKLEGERAVQEVLSEGQWVIVRTAWLYGDGGRNFVDRIVQLGKEGQPLTVVDDQVGNPTWTMVVARAIKGIVEADLSGIYHVACDGAVSWYELAGEILRLTGASVPLKSISTEELGRPARRPSYSALETGKFRRDTDLALELWTEALAAYLGERGLVQTINRG
jgi:dTDP-4-dehydrorhamnose reductase